MAIEMMDDDGAKLAVRLLLAESKAPSLSLIVAPAPTALSLTQFALAMWWLNSIGIFLECVGSNGQFNSVDRVQDMSLMFTRH